MNTPETLIDRLRLSPDWKERRESAIALSHYPSREARNALFDALSDPDEDVMHAAMIALGEVGDEDLVEHLLLPRFLRHPNFQIRWATLKTIGRIGQLCRIPDIADLTSDEVWIVRNEALKLIRTQTESLLEHSSPESAHRLVSLLTSGHDELYSIILDALFRVGPRIKPYLREVLKTGGKQTKVAIANILGRIKDHESIPLLIDLLDSSDKEIRKNAVEALGLIGHESSIPALVEKFADASYEIQHCAVAAIAKIGRAALPALHEKLHYSSWKTVHQNILFTLARIRDRSSIPYLVAHLGSTYFIVRRAAITGLVQYGQEAIDPVLKVIRNIELPMVDDLLSQAERGSTLGIRLRAIKALGSLADHRAVHLLKRLAASVEPDIQKATLESLAQIGCSCWQRCGALAVLRELRIVPDQELIIEQLSDDSENVRLRAIQVLARGGKPTAVPALLRTVAHDPNDNLRYEALRAAEELSPADSMVLDMARRILEDTTTHYQLLAEAARIIGRSPVERYIPLLVACLKHASWEVRRNAALALGNMGKMALPALVERLCSKDELELESVIRAIGNVGSRDAVSMIETVMLDFPENSPVRYAAQKAILEIRDKAA